MANMMKTITTINTILDKLPIFKGKGTDMVQWTNQVKMNLEVLLIIQDGDKQTPSSVWVTMFQNNFLKSASGDGLAWMQRWFIENKEKLSNEPKSILKLVEEAEEEFAGKAKERKSTKQWHSMRQSGTLSMYASDVRRLAHELKMPEGFTIDAFIRGLRSESLRVQLRKEDFETLADAVKRAERLEDAEEPKESSVEEERIIAAARGVCFKCGKPGHKQADCRSKPKSDKQTSATKSCAQCGRRNHTEEQCWIKHPELRKQKNGKTSTKYIGSVTPSKNPMNTLVGYIGEHKIPFCFDSGAGGNYMHVDVVKKLKLDMHHDAQVFRSFNNKEQSSIGTVEVEVKFGAQVHPMKFYVFPECFTKAALGMSAVEALGGQWTFATAQNEFNGQVMMSDGEILPLEPYDEEENHNLLAAMRLVEKHRSLFQPIEMNVKYEPIKTEPYKNELTKEAEELPRKFPPKPHWAFRDQSILEKYFEERLANGMWRKLTEEECKRVRFIGFAFVHRHAGKKDRVVLNYQPGVNRVTEFDPYPMMTCEQVRNATANGTLFSFMDMEKSFNQFPLSLESQVDFAVMTPKHGLLVPTVLQMGPMNSPAAVQRRNDELVETVIAGGQLSRNATLSKPIIDDFTLCTVEKDESQKRDDMERDLDVFLTEAEKRGYRFNLGKSRFMVSQGAMLGFWRGKDGFKPLPSKVKAIEEFPYPKNIEQVRRFLGMMNEYRVFIPNYGAKAEPLNDLTSKSPRVAFGHPSILEAVDLLKSELKQAPVLLPIDPEKPMEIDVDSSKLGWGAVLKQFGADEQMHPCVFVSGNYSSEPEDEESEKVQERSSYDSFWIAEDDDDPMQIPEVENRAPQDENRPPQEDFEGQFEPDEPNEPEEPDAPEDHDWIPPRQLNRQTLRRELRKHGLEAHKRDSKADLQSRYEEAYKSRGENQILAVSRPKQVKEEGVVSCASDVNLRHGSRLEISCGTFHISIHG